ncbi:MAG: polysaccharide deacetylase family protein [Bacillota bacterium]|nr:polysaccharide deacetylase family protein [Bacillota bacterium]
MTAENKIKRAVTVMLTILIIVLLCAGYYAAMGGKITALMNTDERLLPIYSVETDEKVVAVSFDAAWGNEYTDDILRILDEYHARATFFLVGFWIDKYPDDVREIAARGNEIGSHSATHPDLTTCSREQIERELDQTTEKIKKTAGVVPVLFRAPYGAYDNNLINTAADRGYQVVQWDVDSLDWKDIPEEQIVERVVRNVRNGSIVLFHNNAQYVCGYLPQILQKLTDDGYRVVAVGDLILKENYSIDHTGRQFPKTSGSAR